MVEQPPGHRHQARQRRAAERERPRRRRPQRPQPAGRRSAAPPAASRRAPRAAPTSTNGIHRRAARPHVDRPAAAHRQQHGADEHQRGQPADGEPRAGTGRPARSPARPCRPGPPARATPAASRPRGPGAAAARPAWRPSRRWRSPAPTAPPPRPRRTSISRCVTSHRVIECPRGSAALGRVRCGQQAQVLHDERVRAVRCASRARPASRSMPPSRSRQVVNRSGRCAT